MPRAKRAQNAIRDERAALDECRDELFEGVAGANSRERLRAVDQCAFGHRALDRRVARITRVLETAIHVSVAYSILDRPDIESIATRPRQNWTHHDTHGTALSQVFPRETLTSHDITCGADLVFPIVKSEALRSNMVSNRRIKEGGQRRPMRAS